MKMKGVMAAIMGAAALVACTENNGTYTVRGEIAGQNEGQIYLTRYDDKSFVVVDSAEIVDGHFVFSGLYSETMAYGLSTNRDTRRPLLFFIDNGEMMVRIDEENNSISVDGSKSNDIYFENVKLLDNPGYSIDSLIQEHPTSVVPAYFLMRNFAWQLSLERVKELRRKFDASVDSATLVRSIDSFIEKMEALKPGSVAPDFTLPDTLGNNVSLSDFRGKYVLVDFWASWCPDCRKENPNVVEAFRRFGGDNFTILGVSLDRERDPWLAAIEKDELTWTHVSDLKAWKSDAAVLYAVRWIPTNYLINPDGVIIATGLEGMDLQNKLSDIFE